LFRWKRAFFLRPSAPGQRWRPMKSFLPSRTAELVLGILLTVAASACSSRDEPPGNVPAPPNAAWAPPAEVWCSASDAPPFDVPCACDRCDRETEVCLVDVAGPTSTCQAWSAHAAGRVSRCVPAAPGALPGVFHQVENHCDGARPDCSCIRTPGR